MTRKPRNIDFATVDNVLDLSIFLRYFRALDKLENTHYLSESRQARLSLYLLISTWEKAECRPCGEDCADELNAWKDTHINRDGHLLLNQAFAKWRYNRKSKVRKVDVKPDTHDILTALKDILGLNSFDEVICHYLPSEGEISEMYLSYIEKDN